MAYSSLDGASIARTGTVEAALNAMLSQGPVLLAARGGALALTGGEGLPTTTALYDAEGEPIAPVEFWRVGTPVASAPISP